jgi:RNA polymerase subunit RPABC4/transcription elongation factor Spt4
MATQKFASSKYTIAECDRCGFRFKRKELKEIVIRTKPTDLQVCPECWEKDHPQNLQGMYPVTDPQAARNPRVDKSLAFSGGDYSSRGIQWGWNPVGGPRLFDDGLTPNNLALTANVGTVTVTIT